jgi:hypothetical protein
MPFDLQGALKAGYSMSEIAEGLAQKTNFDIAGARSAGYSDDEIVKNLRKNLPESGFVAGVKSGFANLKADVANLGAAAGIEGAEQYAKEQKAKAARTYKQPESFSAAPVDYILGLAGQSLPYMAAPLVAGAGAALLPEAVAGTAILGGLTNVGTAAATGAAGLTSAAQFTGSNLSRQQDEGVAAKDFQVGKAVLASIPQAALDTFSMKMIPGLRNILTKAGVKEVSEAELKKIAEQGLASYGGAALKASGTEGLTEAAQQVFERAQAGLNLTDENARKEYYDNFIGGALLGGVISPVGQRMDIGRAQEQYDTKVAERTATEEAAAAETARKGTPEYKLQVADAHDALVQQRKELQKELIQTAPKKGATEEQIAAHEELKLQRDALDAEIADAKAEYDPIKTEVATLRKEAADTEKRESSDKFLKDVVDNRTTLIESIKELKAQRAETIGSKKDYQAAGQEDLYNERMEAFNAQNDLEGKVAALQEANALFNTHRPKIVEYQKRAAEQEAQAAEAARQQEQADREAARQKEEADRSLAKLQKEEAARVAKEEKAAEKETLRLQKEKDKEALRLQKEQEKQEAKTTLTEQVAAQYKLGSDPKTIAKSLGLPLREVERIIDNERAKKGIAENTEPITADSASIDTAYDRRNESFASAVDAFDAHAKHDEELEVDGSLEESQAIKEDLNVAREKALADAKAAAMQEIETRNPEITTEGKAAAAKELDEAFNDIRKTYDNPRFPQKVRDARIESVKQYVSELVQKHGPVKLKAAPKAAKPAKATKATKAKAAPVPETTPEKTEKETPRITGKLSLPKKEAKTTPAAFDKTKAGQFGPTKTRRSLTADEVETKDKLDEVTSNKEKDTKQIADLKTALDNIRATIAKKEADAKAKGKDKRPGTAGDKEKLESTLRKLGSLQKNLPSHDKKIKEATKAHEETTTAAEKMAAVERSIKEQRSGAALPAETKEDISERMVPAARAAAEMSDAKKDRLKLIQEAAVKRAKKGNEKAESVPEKDRKAAAGDLIKDLNKALKETKKGKSGTVFRIGASENSVDADKAKTFGEQIKAGLPDNVKFHYAATINDAPKDFLSYLVEDGIDLTDGHVVKGGVMPDGTVVIIGDAHTSLSDMEITAAHELIGHYGIDTLLGAKGMRALLKAAKARKDGLRGLAAELGVEDAFLGVHTLYTQRINAAKAKGAPASQIAELEDAMEITQLREIIAEAAEKTRRDSVGKIQDFLKNLINAVRSFFLKNGFPMMMEAKTSDIYELLKQSAKSFESGKIGAYRNPHGDVVFRRKPANPGPNTPSSVAALTQRLVSQKASTWDKVQSAASGINFQTLFVDRFAALAHVARTKLSADEQGGLMMYFARMHDQRMAFTASVVNDGALTLAQDTRGGVTQVNSKNRVVTTRGGANLGGIAKELNGVKGYGNAEQVRDLFTMYLASYRAKTKGVNVLDTSGKTTVKDINDTIAMGDAIPQFVAARKMYNEYNNGLVDWLVESGAIDSQLAAQLKRNQDYVPFYRASGDNVVMEIEGMKPIIIGNIQSQPQLKELLGDENKILDFFTSSLRNTAMITDMGLNNLATKEAAYGLQKAGLVSKFGKGQGPNGTNVIRYKIRGVPHYAVVDEKACEALGFQAETMVRGMHGVVTTAGAMTKVLAIPAKWLRNMIQLSPLYPARQIVRDSVSNFILAGGNMTPVVSAVNEIGKMYAGKSAGEKLLQKRGILGGQLVSGLPGEMENILTRLIKGQSVGRNVYDQLAGLHVRADGAARIALYNSYIKQGMSDMEATLASLESMNFSKRGVDSNLYNLGLVVPFVNSQIQGLNVLYQALRGRLPYAEKTNLQKKIMARGAMMAGMTLAYAAMMEDDDTYKNASLRDRLSNWFIPNPFGEAIKIPIPFEAGILFKAIPEAIAMSMRDDEDATTVMKELATLIGRSSPLGPSNMIPVGVKPIAEAYFNHDFFTGQGVESQHDLTLTPGERSRDKTTGLSKTLGQALGVSPIQIDHLINGYLGGWGLAVSSMVGSVVAPDGPEGATKRASDLPLIGSMFQPNDATGQLQQFYEKATQSNQAFETYKKMYTEGREDEAEKFLEEHANEVSGAKMYEKVKSRLSKMTTVERAIKADPDMTPDEKRERLDEIRQLKIELSKAAMAASRAE